MVRRSFFRCFDKINHEEVNMHQKLSSMTDDELYNRYLKGEAPAGDELMLRYADMLTAYLYGYLKDYQEAEDLMLDAFAVILVDRPGIRPGGFRAYLFRVARNAAYHFNRRKFRQSEFCVSDEVLTEYGKFMDESAVQTPEKRVLLEEQAAMVQKCLDRIPPQYAEALWLVYGAGLSYEQAAAACNCSKKKMSNLLANGKKSMKTQLEKEGIIYRDI